MGRGRCGQRDVRCDREPPLTERLEIVQGALPVSIESRGEADKLFFSRAGAPVTERIQKVVSRESPGLGGLLFLFP